MNEEPLQPGAPLVPDADDIDAFIAMWREAFDETIDPEFARAEANKLLSFFMALVDDPVDLSGLDEEFCDTMPA